MGNASVTDTAKGYMWFPGDSWWVEEPKPAVLWRVNGRTTGTAHVSPNLMLIYRKPDAEHLDLVHLRAGVDSQSSLGRSLDLRSASLAAWPIG